MLIFAGANALADVTDRQTRLLGRVLRQVVSAVLGGWGVGITNPAINTIMADTGALAAGDYEFVIVAGGASQQNGWLEIQYRNGTNAANNAAADLSTSVDTHVLAQFTLQNVLANERVRLIAIVVPPAGVYQASIFATRIN